MDDESYVSFPWMSGGAFESLAELELAYGDNCVDGAIADTAELWASRSGVLSPCVGNWTPTHFSLDSEIEEWAKDLTRRPDENGLYITGFRSWVEQRLSMSAEFSDFVWNRFTELSFESMTHLRRSIKQVCNDDIVLSDSMLYKFRERIGIQPYYVRVSVPPMPDDMERRLTEAMDKARKPQARNMRFRIPKSVFATPKHMDVELAPAITQAKSPQLHKEKQQHIVDGTNDVVDGSQKRTNLVSGEQAGETHE